MEVPQDLLVGAMENYISAFTSFMGQEDDDVVMFYMDIGISYMEKFEEELLIINECMPNCNKEGN